MQIKEKLENLNFGVGEGWRLERNECILAGKRVPKFNEEKRQMCEFYKRVV